MGGFCKPRGNTSSIRLWPSSGCLGAGRLLSPGARHLNTNKANRVSYQFRWDIIPSNFDFLMSGMQMTLLISAGLFFTSNW